MSDEQWYYSLKTHQVVRGDEEKAENRLGPYATREDAAQALKRSQERNEAFDNDPRWADDEDEGDEKA